MYSTKKKSFSVTNIGNANVNVNLPKLKLDNINMD